MKEELALAALRRFDGVREASVDIPHAFSAHKTEADL